MILNVASKLVAGLSEKEDKKGAIRDSVIKRTLGLADAGIPIGREDGPADYIRWAAGQSDATATGTTTGKDAIAWRDYLWTKGATVDECAWETVRWRFYANGLVCFEARMANSSSKLDNGDVQGHRIELREANGLLLGVWIAGFFVRRDLPMRGFATSFVDEHQPLKLHFTDLEAEQSGAWVCL
ncbi:MAG: hypothetical protein CML66_13570 [Rhodobacteraceae bacterium]|nr:hypothetical protein [Paracoccaceae bacterium]MAY45974.1 hypothetical protein [Paracoccaceae bacterium]QEW18609.1 hypothetical protein LA6_000776 [Marinibacterium anthonyi]